MSQQVEGIETEFPCKELYDDDKQKSEESKILYKIATVMRKAHDPKLQEQLHGL